MIKYKLKTIFNKIKRLFQHDVGHIAILQVPKEMIDGNWHDFFVTVDGWNVKHYGTLTTFTGKIRVRIDE